MFSFSQFGNELYSGKRSFDFVGRRRLWYAIGAALMAISALGLVVNNLNPGIEFRGGSEFRISGVQNPDEALATSAVLEAVPDAVPPRVSKVNDDGLRIQTDKLTSEETVKVAKALADDFGVSVDDITTSFVGPSWGRDVSQKAITGLLVFLALVALVIGLYFRTWKMALAALVALLHDLVITVGVYAIIGFEVTPATVIGFLTILGYSLYDTVVVFDKVRENTEHIKDQTKYTYGEAANLAINQTLVRSINTSIVALLPVGAVLFIGAFMLGAGTLKDLSLALFVGIGVGTYSSIFIATPLLVQLREGEPQMVEQAKRVAKRRAQLKAAAERVADAPQDVVVGTAVPVGASTRPSGQRAQPRRSPKGKTGGRR